MSGIEWRKEDVRHMDSVPSESIDVAFDKGTLDAMIHGSPWSPPDDVKENTSQYLREVYAPLCTPSLTCLPSNLYVCEEETELIYSRSRRFTGSSSRTVCSSTSRTGNRTSSSRSSMRRAGTSRLMCWGVRGRLGTTGLPSRRRLGARRMPRRIEGYDVMKIGGILRF